MDHWVAGGKCLCLHRAIHLYITLHTDLAKVVAKVDHQTVAGAAIQQSTGGIVVVATWLDQPIVGGWIESGNALAESRGLTGDAAALVAGQATLSYLSVLPAILIVAFGALWWWMRNRK